MSIDTFSVARVADISDVRIQRSTELLHALLGRDLRISHGIAERDALVGNRATSFGSALLKAARGC